MENLRQRIQLSAISKGRVQTILEYGIVILILIMIGLLYLNSTPYYALFTGDQQAYFLRGLYLAGRDYLQNDWVSMNYKPYHIAFTGLIYVLEKLGILEISIEIMDIGFRIVFLVAIWLFSFAIWQMFFDESKKSILHKAKYPLVAFFLFAFSVNPVNPLSRIFDTLGLERLGDVWRMVGDLGGFAKQWLYGYRVNPASFAVFILLGLSLILFKRWKLATLCFGIAGLFHVSFFTYCALIVLIVIIYLYKEKEEKREALQVFILFSLLVLPAVIYVGINSVTNSSAEANQIFYGKLSSVAKPENFWRGTDSLHLIFICIASIILWWKGISSIFRWIYGIITCVILISLIIGWAGDNRIIELLLPWRVGTFQYPISIVTIFITFIFYLRLGLEKINPNFKHLIVVGAIILFSIGCDEYGIFSPKNIRKYERQDHPNYQFYAEVNKNTKPEDIILIPPDDGAFRLDAQRAVFVDSQNIPGWGSVLVEWDARIKFAEAFYQLEGTERQVKCQEANVDYYALYGIAPDETEPVITSWDDKSLILCSPINTSP
jgi:hypothetical protein